MKHRPAKHLALLPLALALAACTNPTPQNRPVTQENSNQQVRGNLEDKLSADTVKQTAKDPCLEEIKIYPTSYYTLKKGEKSCVGKYMERNYTGEEKDMILRDNQGKEIASVCPRIYWMLLMEGSGYANTPKGTVLVNIDNKKKPTFKRVKNCKYGLDSRGRCLTQYVSTAGYMRKGHWKYGDTIFIQVLNGAKMPDGTYHDGFLKITDVGDNIDREDRIDIFVGYEEDQAWIQKQGIYGMRPVTAYRNRCKK